VRKGQINTRVPALRPTSSVSSVFNKITPSIFICLTFKNYDSLIKEEFTIYKLFSLYCARSASLIFRHIFMARCADDKRATAPAKLNTNEPRHETLKIDFQNILFPFLLYFLFSSPALHSLVAPYPIQTFSFLSLLIFIVLQITAYTAFWIFDAPVNHYAYIHIHSFISISSLISHWQSRTF
jgi:hypothetical protein